MRVGSSVGVEVGGGAGVAVGTGVGAGSGVDVAIGVAVGIGVGSVSSAVPHAAMSGSRAVNKTAMVVIVVIVVVRMSLMVIEWRLAGQFHIGGQTKWGQYAFDISIQLSRFNNSAIDAK